ncbi:ribonuclease HII [Lentisphaera profundi]|uniref:Ribonuclease HII n=1 Tax=Lentisphaera profundi TaxID=1658616 RepID=A0ABY7VU16_9BACT|nr:ribonuclease HII [Lentisphaera profundi]WDE96715.1 ribonuclease HII [Lentisphaera profundi]
MFFFEEHYRLLGFKAIGGVDEVGRGPLAGPVVAACCILREGMDLPEGIDDSKKLSRKKRRVIYDQLRDMDGVDYALGLVEPEEIDKINILQASHLAMRKAVEAMKVDADFLLIDGLPVPGFKAPTRSIVKGDSRSISIAAASILAKEFRDDLMAEYALEYPQYGFEKHMGYGTKLHMQALDEFGPCPLHRRSFAPVRKAENEFK